MVKKFSEMPMPSKKDKKQAESEGFDIFGEGEAPEETDMADEEVGELDLEEPAEASPLADIDDEALLAEVKKRGLSLDAEPASEEI